MQEKIKTTMRSAALLLLFLAFCLFSRAQVIPTLYEQADSTSMHRWVDSVFANMTLEQKVGQLFMPIVASSSDWEKRITGYIRQQKIGGLLFSKGTMTRQAAITNNAQKMADIPLLIAVDGEWGLSMRLTDAPKYPRNAIVGAIQDPEIIRQYGREIGRQCREMGIHVNFAPTIDIHSNPDNPVIGTRSYGENPSRVAEQGIAYAQGVEESGVMAVAKHFPGHGDTSEDSHLTLPTIPHDRARLDSVELFPFKKYIDAGLSGIMIAHLNVPALRTRGKPASLSPEIGIHLLKEEMGFNGVTFSDGMAMKGVVDQPDASVQVLLAGNDIVLGSVNPTKDVEAVKRAVDMGVIPNSLLEEKVRKVLSYKYILGAHRFKPIDTSSLREKVHAPTAEWTLRKIYEGAITLLKDEYKLFPLKGLDTTSIASVTIGIPSPNPFQHYLKKQGDLRLFQTGTSNEVANIKELKEFDVVILSIHSPNIGDAIALQQLAQETKVVLVLFTSPYRLNTFRSTAEKAAAVIVGYDNSYFAQVYAAQGIFGGIAMTGRIPVTAADYPEGSGLNTEKTRLGYSSPEEVGLTSTHFQHIDSLAMEGLREMAYPGCQILIAKNGIIIYEKEFGKQEQGHGTWVNNETVYDLASVTKVAATLPAVMKLYDEKKLALRDSIAKFVPLTKGSDKGSTTIRSLLLHESGMASFIPYYTTVIDEESYSGKLSGSRSSTYHANYAGAWFRTDYKFLPNLIASSPSEQFPLPVAENLYASNEMSEILLKEIIETPLRRVGRYRYSCLNFILLKEAVEEISEKTLDEYVKKHFYRKLGANNTTFRPLEQLPIERIAPTENDPFFRKQTLRGHVHDEGAALFGGISGNAGLFSNANDLAKLCQMWLNGGTYGGERFLSEETVRLFTSTKSGISRRGLGFDKPDPQNTRSNPTSPGTPIETYGHTGFTGTSLWVDPTHDMIFIFLSNRVNPSRSPNRLHTLSIRERIQEEIYRILNGDYNKAAQEGNPNEENVKEARDAEKAKNVKDVKDAEGTGRTRHTGQTGQTEEKTGDNTMQQVS
ncbi:MAG: glycoside hydrolase family 3 N-terminal domain-containing protein [Fermentimonas sp.]